MKVRTALAGTAVALLTAGLVASASSGAPTTDTTALLIRHATVGCHVWTSGGTTATTKTLVLREGQSFTVYNRDNCGHELVEVSGPAHGLFMNAETNTPTSGTLTPLGTGVRFTLDTVGRYVFKTAERDDLAYGVDTDRYDGFARLQSTGTDNTLTLIVKVVPNRAQVID